MKSILWELLEFHQCNAAQPQMQPTRLWRWGSVTIEANSDRVYSLPKSDPAGRLIKSLVRITAKEKERKQMNFQRSLNTHFPNAFPEEAFIKRSYDELLVHGFNAENSIACVSVCRDEITRSLVDHIQKVWGEAFNFSSLGGMLFLGKTGFLAAHHHAPIFEGCEHYVYFAMAHIAIDENGEVGVCHRAGRSAPSGACGALIAFREEMLSGRLETGLNMDDIEQSLLKQRLMRKIRYGEVPELAKLTRIAYGVIVEDLEHMVGITVDPAVSEYAILSGIQIHGPNREQYVWPGEMYVVKGGQRSALVL